MTNAVTVATLPTLGVILAFFSLEPAAAQVGACSAQMAEASDELTDRLHSWPDVEIAFSKYRQCDDGSIAEGNAEGIARLLVDRWNTLPQLQSIVQREPKLREYVLAHVNSTLGSDDLGKIKSLATLNCSAELTSLCKYIYLAAAQALRSASH